MVALFPRWAVVVCLAASFTSTLLPSEAFVLTPAFRRLGPYSIIDCVAPPSRTSALEARRVRRKRKEQPSTGSSEDAPSQVESPRPKHDVSFSSPAVDAVEEEKDDDGDEYEDEYEDDAEYEDDDEDEEEDKYENSVLAGSTPRGDEAVRLAVQDIRTVVRGGGPEPAQASSSGFDYSSFKYSSSSATSPANSPVLSSFGSSSSGISDEALKQLLADAKNMKLQEKGGDYENETVFSLPLAARNVISTIITVDFFVICAFLLWFLAGIVASSVFGNDSIQIAFNGIFEPVVQPALGILMLGALAGAVFKEEEE